MDRCVKMFVENGTIGRAMEGFHTILSAWLALVSCSQTFIYC